MNSFEIANIEELKIVEGGNSPVVIGPTNLVRRLFEAVSGPSKTLLAPLKMVEQYLK